MSKDRNEKVCYSDLRLLYLNHFKSSRVLKHLVQQAESNGDHLFSSESFEYPDCDLHVAWQIASLSSYMLKIAWLMCLFRLK